MASNDSSSTNISEPNNWFRFNPYAIHTAVEGCSRPSSTEAEAGSSHRSSISSSPQPQAMMRSPSETPSPSSPIHAPIVPELEVENDTEATRPQVPPQQQQQQQPVPLASVHREALLKEDVPFLHLPTDIPRPAHWPAFPTIDGPFPELRVFIGQCRYETTAEEIAYILWHTATLSPHSIARHRPGCFVANFLSAEDVETCVRLLHRNILFDTCGVWVARDRREGEAIRRYVATTPVHVFKRAHVPRALVVAEYFRSFAVAAVSAPHHPHPAPHTPQGQHHARGSYNPYHQAQQQRLASQGIPKWAAWERAISYDYPPSAAGESSDSDSDHSGCALTPSSSRTPALGQSYCGSDNGDTFSSPRAVMFATPPTTLSSTSLNGSIPLLW